MDVVLKKTKSVCPECLAVVNAAYVELEGRVWLQKSCPAHGNFEAPVWEDARAFETWLTESPAQPPQSPAMPVDRGCPYDCGLCGAHRQASCCVLLEVTARCNLQCPVCYASAGQAVADDPTLEDIGGWYDVLMAHGGPFNIQLSGGEPTLRDDLAQVIRLGREKGFTFFQLNTNGIRIAEQPQYLAQLAAAGLSTVFLQFDSLNSAPNLQLRGEDLVETKKQAIANCAAAGVGVVLVPTVKPGCNLDDLGEIVKFAASYMPTVRGVHFQPISYFGRYGTAPATHERLTVPGLLAALEAQTEGKVKASDFAPGSAEHALCTFHADYVITEHGWTAKAASGCCCSATPSSDRARLAVADKWSAPVVQLDVPALSGGFKLDSLDEFLLQKNTQTLALSGMAFQDAWTVDLERLCRCHVHVVSLDGRLVPFCAYNLTALNGDTLHRRC